MCISNNSIPFLYLKLPLALVYMLQQIFTNNVIELLYRVVSELFGNVWALHTLVKEAFPIKALEELMMLYFVKVRLASLDWILCEEGKDKGFCMFIFYKFRE